jgi:hypothetical protein
MFKKTNLISTLVTTIWGFMGGYLLWGVLADSFLTQPYGNCSRSTKRNA